MATEPLAFPPADPPFADTPLHELEVVAFDVETSGLDPVKDRILTIGLAVADGPALEAVVYHEAYQPLPKVLDINKITSARAAGGIPLELLEPILADAFYGRVILAHNASFDLRYLIAHTSVEIGIAVDTAAVARHLAPGSKADLAACAERAGVAATAFHGAGVDAWTCLQVWHYQVATLRNRGVVTWRDLVNARAEIPSWMHRGPWTEEVAEAAERRAQRAAAG